MELSTLVSPASRILDVGVCDPGLAQGLAESGVRRYLGLVPAMGIAGLVPPEGLEGRFHRITSAAQVRNNNADVLVLRRDYAHVLWGMRDLIHPKYVAVECTSVRSWIEAQSSQAISRVLGKVRRRGRHSCGAQSFEVFELKRTRRVRPRHYLSEVVGVEGLIHRLREEGLGYVILRWFDELPILGPGEDLDLLVADEHLSLLQDILAEEPGTIPVDVYSESGLEGADYSGMAYYPPALARQILSRAQVHRSGSLVPSPEDHLHSLAYHAVYHKGTLSGLDSKIVPVLSEPDHDYKAALTDVASSLGSTFPTCLEEVDEELEDRGWRPPLDTLRRLADQNPWLQRRFFPTADESPSELPEPAIFFIRERTLTALSAREVLAVFETLEFEILDVRELDGAALAAAVENVRGGNWGRGPFPVSGGKPSLVVVAVHYGPRRPNQVLRARYPRLTNGDVLHAKVTMRELVESRVGTERSFNPVHSSDDEFEAWEYVALALPEELSALQSAVGQRRRAYRTQRPVRSVLSTGRRAKVEVVETEAGQMVVRKTFAPHAQRYFEREVQAMRDLAHLSAVPRLLSTGPNWFETEYYANTLPDLPQKPDGRLVPLKVARQMAQVLREVHECGADLVDAKPQNFLLDPRAGLKLVDFEFYYRYCGEPPEFEDIYSFVGPPPGFESDVPFGELSYESRWRPFVGLSRHSFLYDPAWRQALNRAVFRLTLLRKVPVRIVRAGLRYGRGGARKARASAGASYRQWARARAEIDV